MDRSPHFSFLSSTSHSSETSDGSTGNSNTSMSNSALIDIVARTLLTDWISGSHNSTPIKAGLAMRSQSRLPVKDTLDLLRTEIGKCKHLNINLLDFAVEVWGVDATKARKIKDMKVTLPQSAIDSYKNQRRETDLHQPFITFCDTLLKAALKEVGESDDTIVGGIWDGGGEVILINDGRERKPDLLYMWIPLPIEGVLPKWNETNSVVEMKHHDYKPSKKKAKATSLATSVLTSAATSHMSSSVTSASIAESSEGGVPTLGKRSISAVTDSTAADDRDTKKSRSSFGSKKLQLGNYALEALATTSRYYTTGLLVDTCKVTACYFDRNLVLCAQSFFFDTEPQNLALILYALNQCDLLKAGFDPHLRPWSSHTTPQDVTKAMEVELLRPVKELVGSYFEFPRTEEVSQGKVSTAANEEVTPKTTAEVGEGAATSSETNTESLPNQSTTVRLRITGIIRQPDDLISRGTTVYKVKYQHEDGTVSEKDYALKLSWPLKSRMSEIDVVEHLVKVLPDEVKAHLPSVSFSTSFTCQQLGLPWTRLQLPLDDSNHQERVLRGMVADHYSKLWEAESVDEFMKIWLDCVECEHCLFIY